MGLKNRLLDIRMQLGYKFSKDFATYLGVSPSHYSQWENNIMQPEYEKMLTICDKIRNHEASYTKKLNDIALDSITVECVFYKTAE